MPGVIKNFRGWWVGPHDMYAVIIKRKDSAEWSYWRGIAYAKSLISVDGYPPCTYLHQTLSEANASLLQYLRYQDDLSWVKISRMNKYNLESECEVVGGSYREFK